eukprot:scpid25426/ scgid20663/ 
MAALRGGVLWQQKQFDIVPVPPPPTSQPSAAAPLDHTHPHAPHASQQRLSAPATATVPPPPSARTTGEDPSCAPSTPHHFLSAAHRPGIAVQHSSQLRFNLSVEPHPRNIATRFDDKRPQCITVSRLPKPQPPPANDSRRPPLALLKPEERGHVDLPLVDRRTMENACLLARHRLRHGTHSHSGSSLASSLPLNGGEVPATCQHQPHAHTAPARGGGAAANAVTVAKTSSSQWPSERQESQTGSDSPCSQRHHTAHNHPPQPIAGHTRPNLRSGKTAHPASGPTDPAAQVRGQASRVLDSPTRAHRHYCISCGVSMVTEGDQRDQCPSCQPPSATHPTGRTQNGSDPARGDQPVPRFSSPQEEVIYLRKKLLQLVHSMETSRDGDDQDARHESRKGKLVRVVQSRLHGGIVEQEEDTDTAVRRQRNQATQSARKLYGIQQQVQRISADLGKQLPGGVQHTKKTRALHRIAAAHRAALRTIELVVHHRCNLSTSGGGGSRGAVVGGGVGGDGTTRTGGIGDDGSSRQQRNWQSQLSSLLQDLTLCCAKLELCDEFASADPLELAQDKENIGQDSSEPGIAKQPPPAYSYSPADRDAARAAEQRGRQPSNAVRDAAHKQVHIGPRKSTAKSPSYPASRQALSSPPAVVRARPKKAQPRSTAARPHGNIIIRTGGHRQLPPSHQQQSDHVNRPTFASLLKQHLNTGRKIAAQSRHRESVATRAALARQRSDNQATRVPSHHRQMEAALLRELQVANAAARMASSVRHEAKPASASVPSASRAQPLLSHPTTDYHTSHTAPPEPMSAPGMPNAMPTSRIPGQRMRGELAFRDDSEYSDSPQREHAAAGRTLDDDPPTHENISAGGETNDDPAAASYSYSTSPEVGRRARRQRRHVSLADNAEREEHIGRHYRHRTDKQDDTTAAASSARAAVPGETEAAAGGDSDGGEEVLCDSSSTEVLMTRTPDTELDRLMEQLQRFETSTQDIRQRWVTAAYPDLPTAPPLPRRPPVEARRAWQGPSAALHGTQEAESPSPMTGARTAASRSAIRDIDTAAPPTAISYAELPTPAVGPSIATSAISTVSTSRSHHTAAVPGRAPAPVPGVRPLRLTVAMPTTMRTSIQVNRRLYADHLRKHYGRVAVETDPMERESAAVGRICDELVADAVQDVAGELDRCCEHFAVDLYRDEFLPLSMSPTSTGESSIVSSLAERRHAYESDCSL